MAWMKITPRNLLVLLVPAAALVGTCFLIPGPFGHGVIVGLVVAVAGLSGGVSVLLIKAKRRARNAGGLRPPPLPSATWDRVMPLRDLADQPFSFDTAADQVIVLNFWATWCGPCIRELPSLKRLMDNTADLDIRFGFVTAEDAAVVRAYVTKHDISLPIYLRSGDPPECFRTRGIPATFVIERSGRIALEHIGAAAWDDDDVVAFVRGLATRPAL
jgi:thiol-disulfide isomerase/thioredoxin